MARFYDDVFEYIEDMSATIKEYAAKLNVSAGAVAGAIAEE